MKGDIETTQVYYCSPPTLNTMDTAPPSYFASTSQSLPNRSFAPEASHSVSFPKFYVPTLGRDLDSGFQSMFPNAFASRDISPERWYGFTEELRNKAQITSGCKISTETVLFGVVGFLTSRSARKTIQYMKSVEVRDLVNYWNTMYFNNKGVHISLQQGNVNNVGIYTNYYQIERHRHCKHGDLKFYLLVEAI